MGFRRILQNLGAETMRRARAPVLGSGRSASFSSGGFSTSPPIFDCSKTPSPFSSHVRSYYFGFCNSSGLPASKLASNWRPLGGSLHRWGNFRTQFLSTTKSSQSRGMPSITAALRSSKAVTEGGYEVLVAGGSWAQKMVGFWLFGCAAWVFSLVVLGGVTRLTRSGLSMTDWKFTGSLPPLTAEQWQAEFERYQQSPEYKRVNKGMNVEDFKFIYWMEYAHRMWGRALGIIFALPSTYFIAKGFITRPLAIRLSGLFALGAGQGLVGWWMVKSGLQEPSSEYVQPRVSAYRLAAHLTSAFVIYCGLFWTALSVVMPNPPAGSMGWVQSAAKVRKLAVPISILVGVTAISGAFVAGNDAGHAYNTFPKMGDTWIPDDIFSMEPVIRNFFENTSMVQLNHRILATAALCAVGGLWFSSRKLDIHPAIKSLIGSTLGMSALQVTLGISTLLTYVPVSLASAHQAGALTLFSLMVLLVHTVRRPSPAILRSLKSISSSPQKVVVTSAI